MAFARKKSSEDTAAAPPAPPKRAAKAAKVKPQGGKSVAKVTGKRFVLVVGDEGAILVFMHGAKVVRRLFAPSVQPTHTEAVREIMRTNPHVPVYLLADVLDQQYVPHSFPPVSSLSVGGLVKRRLDRDFQTEDLKGALPLGRDKTGRKEWKFLLVALAKTDLISGWLDLLVDLPNEMKGIYLSPVEAVNYLAMLNKKLDNDKPQPWQLLISFNKVSGFRQVVMRDGKLVFTRVSQAIDDAVPAVLAGNIEQEIINTVEYLKRLQFNNNADLDATIVIAQDVGELIDLNRFGFSGKRVLSPLAVAELLGLEQAALSADRFGDVVMAAAFAIAKKRTLRFSTAYIDKLEKLYKVGVTIRAGAALLAISLLGLTAVTAIGMWADHGKGNEAREKLEKLQPELRKAEGSVAGLNKDVTFKAAVVATYESYVKGAPKLEDFARSIAAFLTPQARLISVNWVYSSDKVGAPPAPGGASYPVAIRAEFDLSGAGANVQALNQEAKNLMESMKIGLPQYEAVAEPFPWLREEPRQEEITLDVKQFITVSAQNMIAVINFRGPKPSNTEQGGMPPSPAAPGVPTPGTPPAPAAATPAKGGA